MSATVTLLATAAATVGAVRLMALAKARLRAADRRVEGARRGAPSRDDLVLDLEPGADGVYGVAPPAPLDAPSQADHRQAR